MKSKNSFYIIFWLAGCLFVLGYLCLEKTIMLNPKYIVCFSISAFTIVVASFLIQVVEEFRLKRYLRFFMDLLIYLFMGLTMFSLVVFPFIIDNIEMGPISNCLTLWSLGLIFMSTVLKEIKYNLTGAGKEHYLRPEPEKSSAPTARTKTKPETT